MKHFAKLTIILLASFSLINLKFLLPETAQFDETTILTSFVFTTFGFNFCIFSTLPTVS